MEIVVVIGRATGGRAEMGLTLLEARAAPTKAMKPMMAEVTMAQKDLPK